MEVKDVILWSNGMVMVLNKCGDQIPELQGRYLDRREAILDAADRHTKFYLSKWSDWQHEITREEFKMIGDKNNG